ncbi:MAG TPA: universal stress protein [Kiritimatiellia bacterium]|nr:universal stress protein [Kiritimatiellia bacterium]
MFTKVLLASDLSLTSQRMVEAAAQLKAWGTTEIVLLQCLGLQELPEEIIAPSRDFLLHNLDDQKKLLVDQGFAVTAEVRTGLPKVEIHRVARERGASLIVVGAMGESLAGDLLGGVASAVIHTATRPVLVFRPSGSTSAPPSLLDHVLFPTDFSASADHAFGSLKQLAGAGAKRVTLLHVQDQSRIDPHLLHRLPEFNTLDEQRLDGLRADLGTASGCEIEPVLTYGHPVADILATVRDRSVSLVVMASQGKGFLAELFLGSVSHHVTRHAPVSVLLIPTPRDREGIS